MQTAERPDPFRAFPHSDCRAEKPCGWRIRRGVLSSARRRPFGSDTSCIFTLKEQSATYGVRGIVDSIAVLIFVWTAHRVGVAARSIQADWHTSAGANSLAQCLKVMAHILNNWQAYLLSPGIIGGAILVGILAHRMVFSVLAKPSLKMSVVDASLVRHCPE